MTKRCNNERPLKTLLACQSYRYYKINQPAVQLLILLFLSTVTSAVWGQSNYMQGRITLSLSGNNTKFYTNNFYQTDARSAVKMYDRSATYINGDSIVSLGTWSQTVNTSAYFTPKLNAKSNLYNLTFTSSENAVFRNISFLNMGTSANGLLLREKNTRKTLRIGGDFNMPNMPVFLGSGARTNVQDYLKDVDLFLILRIQDTVRYVGLTANNFIVTSSKSAIEDSISPNQAAVFPVGYDSNHFTPVCIENPTQDAIFRVTASRSYYDWNPSFRNSADTVNKSNIKPSGVNVMWDIYSQNSAVSANIFAQIPKNTDLIQQAYKSNSSMLVRYVYQAPNEKGNYTSNTYWDNSDVSMNVDYTIFPNVQTSNLVNTVRRQGVSQFDKYRIFTLTSYMSGDIYPLSTRLPAIEWSTAYVENSPFTSPSKQLYWLLNNTPRRVDSFVIFASKTSSFDASPTRVGSTVSSQSIDFTMLLPTTVLNKKPEMVHYKITPTPILPEDTLLYDYTSYFLEAFKPSSDGSKASLLVMNNPYSLSSGEEIECLITPKPNENVKKIMVNLVSATAYENLIFKKQIENVSNDPVTITLNPSLNALYVGHYILVAEIEYESGAIDKVYGKFSIY